MDLYFGLFSIIILNNEYYYAYAAILDFEGNLIISTVIVNKKQCINVACHQIVLVAMIVLLLLLTLRILSHSLYALVYTFI